MEVSEDRHNELVTSQDPMNESNDALIMDRDGRYLSDSKSPSISQVALNSYYNYLKFCILFSITHATVDGVLAYASSELGSTIGSYSGFALYFFYTISSLLLAKPIISRYKTKNTVLFGLIGLLFYVGSFFIAIISPSNASSVFIIGSSIGGIGAGLIWTGQGGYYALNSIDYFKKLDFKDSSETSSDHGNQLNQQILVKFASLFAFIYLSFETFFKILATIIYVAYGSDSSNSSWKVLIFGLYTVSAIISVFIFWRYIWQLFDDSNIKNRSVGHSFWQNTINDMTSVSIAIMSMRKLQLLIPYQICFGFSSGLINYYVSGFIVSKYIGDGYIGFLSSLTTVIAALIIIPATWIANKFNRLGRWIVMMIGGCCFLFNSASLLTNSDKELGTWLVMILYFSIHGIARGVWESTNKAVVTEYFEDEEMREIAFGAIYFTSGISGAIGYVSYQYMSRFQLALLNTLISILAIGCYHFSTKIVSSQDHQIIDNKI